MARHRGVHRFVADVLADNRPCGPSSTVPARTRGLWRPASPTALLTSPEPLAFGIEPHTETALAALVRLCPRPDLEGHFRPSQLRMDAAAHRATPTERHRSWNGFTATVLAENRPSFRLLPKAGRVTRREADGCEVDLDVELSVSTGVDNRSVAPGSHHARPSRHKQG